MNRAALSPASSLISALLTMGTLIVAMHYGGAASVGSYGVGVSVAALVGVIVGGGTSLAFVSGSVETQRSVRSIRLKLVMPVGTLAVAVIALFYAAATDLPSVPLVLGGVTGLLNNLSELENGFLRRHLKTPTLLVVDVFSRSLALLGVLLHLDFALAMAVAAFVRLLLLSFAARKDPSRSGVAGLRIGPASVAAYRPALFWITVLYAAVDRSLFLVSPLVLDALLAGYFAAMLSSLQAVSGALVSGLHTLLAARSEKAVGAPWGRRFEKATVVIALALAAGGASLSGLALSVLSIPATAESRIMWALLCVSLPLAVINRAMHFHWINTRVGGRAVAGLASACAAILIVCLFAFNGHAALWLAAALFIGECAGCAVGLLLHLRAKWALRP